MVAIAKTLGARPGKSTLGWDSGVLVLSRPTPVLEFAIPEPVKEQVRAATRPEAATRKARRSGWVIAAAFVSAGAGMSAGEWDRTSGAISAPCAALAAEAYGFFFAD